MVVHPHALTGRIGFHSECELLPAVPNKRHIPPALLRAKVAIRSYGVSVYPGGTFFEVAIMQNKVDSYFHRCKDIGFNYIETSVS